MELGYESMPRRAKMLIFWIGMPGEIEQMAKACYICQQNKPENQKETLVQHNTGQVPWEKIGLDLCEFQGHMYLISVDYFFNL